MAIEVTARDTETGESSTRTITDDFVLVTAGRHFLASVTRHANGTTQLTVRVDRTAPTEGAPDETAGVDTAGAVIAEITRPDRATHFVHRDLP